MAIAKCDTFLIDGYNVACALRSFAPSAQTEEIDATTLCNTFRQYELGFKMGELTAEGKFASDSVNLDEIHDILAAAFDAGTAKIVTAGIGFYALGGDAVMMDAITTKYDIPLPVGALILSNASMRSTNGMNFGKWLMNDLVAEGTTNGTSIDNGAATTNGGIFHAHLHNDTATGVVITFQHSTDDSTWVDLAATGSLSAAYDSESVTVAAGTTVNRHTRAKAVATGGDTILVSAAFARRY